MKVHKKSVHVQNDCFSAEEKGCRVEIRRHRHHILIDVLTPGGVIHMAELTLAELSEQLAHGQKIPLTSRR